MLHRDEAEGIHRIEEAHTYTGRSGPCVVAGAATADSAQALASLDAPAGLPATVGLSGHGPAWNGPMSEAVERAKAAGPA